MTVEMQVELLKAALEGIAAILEKVSAAHDGTVDPAAVLADLGNLHALLVSNDAAADKSLDDKFPR